MLTAVSSSFHALLGVAYWEDHSVCGHWDFGVRPGLSREGVLSFEYWVSLCLSFAVDVVEYSVLPAVEVHARLAAGHGILNHED